MPDDEKHLASVAARERCDDESLVAGSSHRRDESFLLQAVQGAAHGRPAQSHARHHRALGDARAGREAGRTR